MTGVLVIIISAVLDQFRASTFYRRIDSILLVQVQTNNQGVAEHVGRGDMKWAYLHYKHDYLFIVTLHSGFVYREMLPSTSKT